MIDELAGRLWVAHHQAFGQWTDGIRAAVRLSPNRASATLVLTRRDICGLMAPADWLEAVETGFRAAASGQAHAPPPMEIEGAGGAFHGKGASLALERRYAALKLNGNFPGNAARHGLPTIQGAILLCDGDTGRLLAIMDSIEVTLRRTAAASALAARHLARPLSESVLICGCGEQGRAHLLALRDVLPLKRCFVWDIDPARSKRFAQAMRDPALSVDAVPDLPGRADVDAVVTCTTATRPFLGAAMVRDGTFVAAVGADSPAKSEIMPDLMAKAVVVADVLSQCEAMGDLRHAIAAGLDRNHVHAELADLVSGARPGRTGDDQITLFDSTGTAIEDVAAAAMIYERACRRPSRIMAVDLGRAP